MKKSIAFFDFDGTITKKDTLIEIVRFYKGNSSLYAGLFILSPWLIAMKLKLVSNRKVKEIFLSHFFKNTPVDEFRQICNQFAESKVPALIRQGATRQLNEFKERNIPVVIVSASPENWIGSWCAANGFHCIATILETKEGYITGKIEGENCYGAEKVRRIQEKYSLQDYNEIFCFGDTKGDKPMLSLATSAYYKPFR